MDQIRGFPAANDPVRAGERRRTWLARLALLALVAAAAVLVGAGWRRSAALVVIGLVGLTVMIGAAWWFVSRRGVLRWLAFALAVAVPLVVTVMYARRGLLWVAVLTGALLVLAYALARDATTVSATASQTYESPPPRQPFFIMNSRSGGGKVVRFGLDDLAQHLGARVALIGGYNVDVAGIARDAVAMGADLLGVAGGDGTQASVAAVAAQYDLPFVVVSAGTRNHFARDLGLDCDDPRRCLDALRDGVELRVDLGVAGGRPFVNTASFGAYADVVQRDDYRADKGWVSLDQMPDALARQRRAALVVEATNWSIEGPQALLVSNNPYDATASPADVGRRTRLDSGLLGVLAVNVHNAAQAAGLVRGVNASGLTREVTDELLVHSAAARIPVAVDGEALMLTPPVRCRIRPKALRVRVPRHRPGLVAPATTVDWRRIWRTALGSPSRTGEAAG